MQAFREWLRASLDHRGWTASDLERASGVNNSIIWRWLAEPPRRPTPANLTRIAQPLGTSYEDLMRLCGYLPGEPRAQVDARRQVVRDQLDRWLNAVGPEYEDQFWESLKDQADSTVRLIGRIRTAVSEHDGGAVSDAVSQRATRGRRRRSNPDSPLSATKHAIGARSSTRPREAGGLVRTAAA